MITIEFKNGLQPRGIVAGRNLLKAQVSNRALLTSNCSWSFTMFVDSLLHLVKHAVDVAIWMASIPLELREEAPRRVGYALENRPRRRSLRSAQPERQTRT